MMGISPLGGADGGDLVGDDPQVVEGTSSSVSSGNYLVLARSVADTHLWKKHATGAL